MKLLTDVLADAKIEYQTDLPLCDCSSFRIGGAAELAVLPHSKEELVQALTILRKHKVPVTVIGCASNVVFPDEGLGGAILFTGGCRAVSIEGESICADSGVRLGTVAAAARDASLSGAEFLYGIPGTLGGAVFMNAGAFGGCMADICVESEYYDLQTGRVGVLRGEEQGFGTRESVYEKNPSYVILGARMKLFQGDSSAIADTMKEYLERRRATQPLDYPSAGSVFKRPVGHFAGKLIEDCGLKGMRIGGAEVSPKHAGFIVNRGDATARDVRELTEAVQKTVLEMTGVQLEREIRFL